MDYMASESKKPLLMATRLMPCHGIGYEVIDSKKKRSSHCMALAHAPPPHLASVVVALDLEHHLDQPALHPPDLDPSL
jgi:hypothetical protein